VQLKTILNRVQKLKSFVYGEMRWEKINGETVLYVEIYPRLNSRPICSGCGRAGPGYDRLEVRPFEFVPLWGIAVFFMYMMRRVDCGRCGVKVESCSMGGRKADVDSRVHAVFSRLGEAAFLEGGRSGLRDVMGESLSVRGMDRGLGTGPSRTVRCDGDWSG
jgi:hypothetical protein